MARALLSIIAGACALVSFDAAAQAPEGWSETKSPPGLVHNGWFLTCPDDVAGLKRSQAYAVDGGAQMLCRYRNEQSDLGLTLSFSHRALPMELADMGKVLTFAATQQGGKNISAGPIKVSIGSETLDGFRHVSQLANGRFLETQIVLADKRRLMIALDSAVADTPSAAASTAFGLQKDLLRRSHACSGFAMAPDGERRIGDPIVSIFAGVTASDIVDKAQWPDQVDGCPIASMRGGSSVAHYRRFTTGEIRGLLEEEGAARKPLAMLLDVGAWPEADKGDRLLVLVTSPKAGTVALHRIYVAEPPVQPLMEDFRDALSGALPPLMTTGAPKNGKATMNVAADALKAESDRPGVVKLTTEAPKSAPPPKQTP